MAGLTLSPTAAGAASSYANELGPLLVTGQTALQDADTSILASTAIGALTGGTFGALTSGSLDAGVAGVAGGIVGSDILNFAHVFEEIGR